MFVFLRFGDVEVLNRNKRQEVQAAPLPVVSRAITPPREVIYNPSYPFIWPLTPYDFLRLATIPDTKMHTLYMLST